MDGWKETEDDEPRKGFTTSSSVGTLVEHKMTRAIESCTGISYHTGINLGV